MRGAEVASSPGLPGAQRSAALSRAGGSQDEPRPEARRSPAAAGGIAGWRRDRPRRAGRRLRNPAGSSARLQTPRIRWGSGSSRPAGGAFTTRSPSPARRVVSGASATSGAELFWVVHWTRGERGAGLQVVAGPRRPERSRRRLDLHGRSGPHRVWAPPRCPSCTAFGGSSSSTSLWWMPFWAPWASRTPSGRSLRTGNPAGRRGGRWRRGRSCGTCSASSPARAPPALPSVCACGAVLRAGGAGCGRASSPRAPRLCCAVCEALSAPRRGCVSVCLSGCAFCLDKSDREPGGRESRCARDLVTPRLQREAV